MIVVGAALEVARHIFDLREASVLCLGRDSIMEEAVASFHAARPRRLLKMASPPVNLHAFDVVLCSLGGPTPLITRTAVQRASRARKNRPIFLADLALPGDVEHGVGELEHIFLYTIDDFRNMRKGSRP